jgi:hypothetical protein
MKSATFWILVGLLALPQPARAKAVKWSTAFSGVRDTVVFMMDRETLVRAPFDLGRPETLWTAPRGEHIVRLVASPDRTRIAWLSRSFAKDTTRLWVWDSTGAMLRMRFFAFDPQPFGYQFSVPGVPTLTDEPELGGRLVRATWWMRESVGNALAWTPDSRMVVCATKRGLTSVAVSGERQVDVFRLPPLCLEALYPSPMFLVDALRMRPMTSEVRGAQGRIEPTQTPSGLPSDLRRRSRLTDGTLETELWFKDRFERWSKDRIERISALLVPSAHGWRVFQAHQLASGRVRTASESSVWWASGRTICAIRAYAPDTTEEFETPDEIAWLHFDPVARNLVWVAGRWVGRVPEGAAVGDTVLTSSDPIRRALAAPRTRTVAFVTHDSLLVWDPVTDRVHRFACGGLDPISICDGPDGQLIVGAETGIHLPPTLARADKLTNRLVGIETPAITGGTLQVVGNCEWILLFAAKSRRPRTLQAYDVHRGTWVLVENPGVRGWERLGLME